MGASIFCTSCGTACSDLVGAYCGGCGMQFDIDPRVVSWASEVSAHPDILGLRAVEDFRRALDPDASAEELAIIARKHIGNCEPECCYGGDLSWLIFIVAAHPNLSWDTQRFIFDFDTQGNGDYAKAIAESLLHNPNCDPGIIEFLSISYFDNWVIDLIYHHPNTPPSVIATYEEEFDLPPQM